MGIENLFSAWCVISTMDGIRDAYVYHSGSNWIKTKPDVHFIYTAHRATILLGLGYACQSLPDTAVLFSCCALIFPMLHDNTYYLFRNHLSHGEVYPDGARSRSIHTTARISFGYRTRIALAIISLTLFFIYKHYASH